MTTYFIPGSTPLYASNHTQFIKDGVTYPKGWLSLATPEDLEQIQATPRPAYDSATQHVEKSDEGWVVIDYTTEELEALQAQQQAAQTANIAEAINHLWKEAWGTWGESQIAAVDRQTINLWATSGKLSATGMQMVADLITWHDTIFMGAYAQAKAAIEAAKGWVEPDWSSWPPCPHGFYDFVAQRV
jgi:hypothetical protein